MDWLAFWFAVITHVILAIALVAWLLLLIDATFLVRVRANMLPPQERQALNMERLLRGVALASGALLAFGSKAVGLSIPALLSQSLVLYGPVGFGLLAVAFPAGLGIAVGWYMSYVVKQRAQQAVRFLIFIGVLVLVEFGDMYATAIRTSGIGLNVSLAPNLAFIVAAGIYAFSSYGPNRVRRREAPRSTSDDW